MRSSRSQSRKVSSANATLDAPNDCERDGYAECTDYPPPPSDNKCAICHRDAERSLDLDHDHETGKFRGYICRECNMGLGKLGDTVEAIKRVLAYLERARE
jgi:hypothetical protein